MHELTLQATFGGLLHDIEKPVCRSGAPVLCDIRENIPAVSDCLRYSHAEAIRSAALPKDSPAYLVYAANALSAAGRREEESGTFDRTLPLSPVFTHMNGEHPGFGMPLTFQDGRLHLPRAGLSTVSAEDYAAVAEKLRAGLAGIQPEERQINALLCLLEDCLSFVPAGTDSPDISLYDHSKVTAAIAACISEYLLAQGETDFGKRLLAEEAAFRQEAAFLLYSADFSGIQKFIFTVATKGALASLRSRSFFLELLMEHYIDELLTACSLSRANLLYSGGGHGYLLLPNTSAAVETVNAWNLRMNDWLLERFGTELFIAHGWTACSGNDLRNTPAEKAPYTEMFRRVSGAVARHKLCRYSPDQLRRINSRKPAADGRECKICGRSDRLSARNRCPQCEMFVTLSQKILSCPVYFVSREAENADFTLPAWSGDAHFSLTDEKTARARLENGEAALRVYAKNHALAGPVCGTRLYVGDYAASSDMERLCADSRGIARLGVCRMDVDNLGQAFVSGFRCPDEPDIQKRDRFLTLSRTAAFSRQMSLFFKCYINPILSRPRSDGRALSVTVVYSGGDDVFFVGAWDSVMEAAQRIQQEFHRFCCGALTISAGISLHNDHFPIRQAADRSAELEDCAKRTPGKNAVSLFAPDEGCTYPWQVFREKVQEEKFRVLYDFFHGEEQERGNAFLYQLLAYLRDVRPDRLNLARYAYLLSKMEPRDAQRREAYRVFSDKMYRWGLSAEDRRQLITAIYLYVYLERKQV